MAKDLNLLPLEVIKRRQAGQQTKMMILFLILMGLICLLLTQTLIIKKVSLEKKKNDLTRQINSLSEAVTIEKNIQSQKQRLVVFQDVLSQTGNTTEVFRDVLDRWQNAMPENLFVLDMNVSKDKIAAKGSAAKERDVADFIRKLKDSGAYEDVFVSEITRNLNVSGEKGDNFVNFNLSCTIKLEKGSSK